MLLTLAILAGVAVALMAAIYMCGSQRHLEYNIHSNLVGRVPVVGENALVELAPGLRMKFDTGCDFSIITQEDLQRIKDLGLKVDSSYYPQLGRDRVNHTDLRWRRYTVDLPVGKYRYIDEEIDTVPTLYEYRGSFNVIHNVDFVAAKPGETSTVGIDLLEQFALEIDPPNTTMSLYDTLPPGYKPVESVDNRIGLTDLLTLGHRYYCDLNINGRTYRFFIDTGIKKVPLKMPAADVSNSRRSLRPDSIMHAGHMIPVTVDPRGWVKFGNRAGSYDIYYYDSEIGAEPYTFNPMHLFTQPTVIDFRHGVLALHPYVVLPRGRTH